MFFVHHTSIQGNGFKSLAEGDSVSFDTEKGTERPQGNQCSKAVIDRQNPPCFCRGIFYFMRGTMANRHHHRQNYALKVE